MVMPPQDPGEWLLQPGETKTFEVETDGWTQDILSAADGKQIFLQLIVLPVGNGKPVGYLAVLPDISTLPAHELVLMDRANGKDTRGAPLAFMAVPQE